MSTNPKSKQQLRERTFSKVVYASLARNDEFEKITDEIMQVFENFHTGEVERARQSFRVGDSVVNVSGWGVGANSSTPLKVKSILLEVDWEGSKSTRWLSSKEVEHLQSTESDKS